MADTMLLRMYATWLLYDSKAFAYKIAVASTELSAYLAFGLAWYLSTLNIVNWKLCGTIVLIVIFAFWSWYGLLKNRERLYLRNYVSQIFMRNSLRTGN